MPANYTVPEPYYTMINAAPPPPTLFELAEAEGSSLEAAVQEVNSSMDAYESDPIRDKALAVLNKIYVLKRVSEAIYYFSVKEYGDFVEIEDQGWKAADGGD